MLAVLMGLAIGWSNLAYVLAVLEGEVMRVLLLFYLAPLWTVPIAWILLGEKLDRASSAAMALALARRHDHALAPGAGIAVAAVALRNGSRWWRASCSRSATCSCGASTR